MPKIFKEYVLPHPKSDYDYEFEWKPIVIPKNKIVPFGYKAHPEDPDILLPVVRELDLMEDAKRHLKKFSYRDVAAWLTTQSGRSISADGLRRRVLSEKRHARKITNAEQLAEHHVSIH